MKRGLVFGIIFGLLIGIFLISVVSAEELVWSVTSSQVGDESGWTPIHKIIEDGNDLYVVGSAVGSDGEYEWLIEKRNKLNGSLTWQVIDDLSIGTRSGDTAYSVAVDSDYLYIGGRDEGTPDGLLHEYQWAMQKRRKSDGVLEWNKTADLDSIAAQESGDTITDLVIDDTYVYFVGTRGWTSLLTSAVVIQKRAKSAGNLIQETIFEDIAEAFEVTSDNDFLYITSGTEFSYDWDIRKIRKDNGNLEWNKKYLSEGVDYPYTIDSDDDYLYIAGRDEISDEDYWRIEKRRKSDGELEWSLTSPESDVSFDVDLISGNEDYFYVGGTIGDRWVLEKRSKLDGSLIWERPRSYGITYTGISSLAEDGSFLYVLGKPNYEDLKIEKWSKFSCWSDAEDADCLHPICSCEDLQQISTQLSWNYKLMNDIDCSDTIYWNNGEGFDPIGALFRGNLYGNGFSINNLSINRPTKDGVGLFYNLDDESIVRNLRLVNVDITGMSNTGGFSGHNSGTIFDVSVVSGRVEGTREVGGLVGTNSENISYSSSSANVFGSLHNIGGLVGTNWGFIANSHATGDVTGASLQVGGLVGDQTGSLRAFICDSYATGNVIGDYRVGGLVGVSIWNISRSYATGDVTGNGDYIGGLVGYMAGSGRGYGLSNSYARGNVVGDRLVGGLSGNVVDFAINSYSTGTVSGNSLFGGLAGLSSGSCSNSFWDIITSGQATSYCGAIGKTTAQMKQQSTFVGWDFTNIWGIDPLVNNGYPTLKQQGGCLSIPEILYCSEETCSDGIQNQGETGTDCGGPCPACPTAGDVYWADMEGTHIDTAQINDTVMLVYSDASPGNFFEIYEDDGTVGDDDVRTGTNKLNSVLRDGKSIAIWKITDEDYENGCCFLGFCENQGQFYFKANGDSDLTSLNLNVSNIPNNSPPFVKIIKPEYESKHLLGSDIAYKQIAVDTDDDLRLTWTFGDGTTANFDNVKAQNLGNTTHIYDSTGVKNIVLTAKEMTREKEASNRSRVLIYDEGIHTYALIDSPVPDVPYSYQRIPIIANRSHIAECFSDSGACSTKASSWSSSCYPVTGSIGGISNTLNCFDYPTSQPLSGYNLFFEWTFDSGKGYESKRAGSWNSNYTDVIDSYKIFTRTGRHDINLIMGYLFDN